MFYFLIRIHSLVFKAKSSEILMCFRFAQYEQVVDKWIVDWGTYLSSNQSVIYAKIDGRGSGLRGDKLLHSVYLKLGTVEIMDQINVTR